MSNFLNDLAKIANNRNQNTGGNISPFVALYMKVHEIKTENNETFAYGLDMIGRTNIRVRLNNIDEGANDFIITKRAFNLIEAKSKITSLYTGHNSRESLEKKKTKRHTQYLYFERAVLLNEQQSFMPTYRAHWSYSMSQLEDVEMVIGHANIQYRPARQNGDQTEKHRAHAQIIEFMRYFTLGHADKNLKMIEFALNNNSKNMIREGLFTAQIESEQGVIASFNIFQRYAEVNTTDANNNAVTFLAPQEPPVSVNYFMEKDGGDINTYSMTKDIGRIVLHVFCGFDLDYNLFASNDPEYLGRLNDLKDQLLRGELRVKVFGFRIYRFGPESITHLKPNGNFNPLKQYSKQIQSHDGQQTGSIEQMYVPTVLILHKTINNRRYIAYQNKMHYNVIREGKPLSLSEFNENHEPIQIKTTQLMLL